jgi:hypothetical protein
MIFLETGVSLILLVFTSRVRSDIGSHAVVLGKPILLGLAVYRVRRGCAVSQVTESFVAIY